MINVQAMVDAIHDLINKSPYSPTKDQLAEVIISHAPDMPAEVGVPQCPEPAVPADPNVYTVTLYPNGPQQNVTFWKSMSVQWTEVNSMADLREAFQRQWTADKLQQGE